ncbi:MAG: ribose-phosphate pyrophosphokinase [Gammaproteobacteria bacterium]|nr:ribose-phosphate pyrophosphokinase [Gammaproteobacteria bacterium]
MAGIVGNPDLRLFALSESGDLGTRMASHLGITLADHEERSFDDGEHKARPLENVSNRDVFVVQSLYGDDNLSVNDKLVRLLFFLGSLKDAAAARITAVLPYLCYARKDRRTKSRDPLATRYIAQLIEAVGTDRILALDVHNPAAFENAFRRTAYHLTARTLFVEHFAPLLKEPPVVVSPDVGGAKRAEAFRQLLGRRLGSEPGSAFLEKYRSGGEVTGQAVVGEMEGRTVIVIDDMVSSGGTLVRAARACRDHGAARIYAAATHGLFTGDAATTLNDPALDALVVTDSIPPFRLDGTAARDKLAVLDVAPMLAHAVGRVHEGGSIQKLMGME